MHFNSDIWEGTKIKGNDTTLKSRPCSTSICSRDVELGQYRAHAIHDNTCDYLRNCPHSVHAECFAYLASAKQFNSCNITTGEKGLFTLKSGDKSYSQNISGGNCSCPYFTKRNIHCKHMFAIFNLFPQQWSWCDLPLCLANNAYMTLDAGMPLLKEAMFGDSEGCSSEMQVDLDSNSFVCSESDVKNKLPSDVLTSDSYWISPTNGEFFKNRLKTN